MFVDDVVSWMLGLCIIEIVFGCVVVMMMVCVDMFNGFVICYGGLIVMFVDLVFVFVCNSCNVLMVVLGFGIDIFKLVWFGDVLMVMVEEILLVGCIGFYDIMVKNQNGELIVVFCGCFYCFGECKVFEV